MSDARVNIPLTGGLDDSTDPLALRPPFLAESENTRINKKGTISKRPGWSGILDTRTGSPLVVAGEDRILTMGANGGTVVDLDGNLVDLSSPATFPVSVERFDVAAPSGYVHSVQAKASDTHVCVVWSFVGNVNAEEPANDADAATPTQTELDFQVAGAILDSDLRVVWGPHLMPPEMKWLPRVEPIDDEAFVVFAAGDEAMTGYNAFATGESTNLYACRYDVGVDPLVAGADFMGQFNVPCACQAYDTTTTYPDLPTNVAVAAMNREPGAGHDLRVIAYLSVPGTPMDVAIAEPTSHDVAIHWDGDTTTLLIYEGGDKLVHYTTPTLVDASVAAPTLAYLTQAGAAGTFGYDYHPGPAWQRPHFYRDASGDLYLNEVPVTLTGTGPATPSFGSAETERLPMLFNPLVLSGQTVYVAGTGTASDSYKHGADGLDLYYIDTSERFAVVTPIGETRLGNPGHALFQWQFNRTSATGLYTRGPLVAGQAATLDGALLFPLALLTSSQNPRGAVHNPRLPELSPGAALPATLHITVSPNVHGGAGFYNDETTVALVRVSQSARQHSSVRFGPSRLLASGAVRVWSGDRALHALAVRRPVLGTPISTDSDVTYYRRRVATAAVGVNPASTAGTGEIKWDGKWAARAVLVATDANGLQYRSEPSNLVPGWELATDATPTYCPVFPIVPNFAVQELLDAGLSVDVELYATERAEAQVTTPADIDETTLTLVCRMPLQQDQHGYYVVDLLTDYARFATVSLGWGLPTELPQRESKALYTVSGDLPPVVPPAAHVLARAGNYVFLVPSEAPTELWFSKPLVPGRAPEFSPLLSVNVPPEAGRIISIAGTYDRLFVLTESGVLELPAISGPDASGTGSFPPFRVTYEGEPCVTHMGTVSTPSGVFYVSLTGPKLLGGDGAPSDLGDRAGDLLDWTAVVDVAHHEYRNEIVWFTSSAAAVLNTATGTWSTWDLLTAAVDVMGTRLLRINQAGNLRADDATATTDGAAYPLATVTTAWIDFGDPLAWKRANELVILGRIENDPTPALGKLLVEVAYDYDDTVVDSFDFRLEEIPTHPDGTFRLELMPTRGKSDAIKVTIRDTTETSGQTTANNYLWTIANLEIRARGKSGLSKLPATAKGG